MAYAQLASGRNASSGDGRFTYLTGAQRSQNRRCRAALPIACFSEKTGLIFLSRTVASRAGDRLIVVGESLDEFEHVAADALAADFVKRPRESKVVLVCEQFGYL